MQRWILTLLLIAGVALGLTACSDQTPTEADEPIDMPMLATNGYDRSPQSMWDFKWPYKGIYNSSGGEQWKIIAGYGDGYHTDKANPPSHHAVDLVRADGGRTDGSWVLAPAYGTIVFSGNGDTTPGYRGYGYCVEMDHGNGYRSLVAHLKTDPSAFVRKGNVLLQGTFLGYCGATGKMWGAPSAHIHFVVTKNGRSIPLSGISNIRDIVENRGYSSGNAYVRPPRGNP